MMQSEHINELVTALSKAQGEMETPKFNCQNPYYKSRYADLTSVIECIRIPLSNNGLCFSQIVTLADNQLVLSTLIAHTSGQWIKSNYPLFCPKPEDSQALGKCITYAKRYSLQAILGISAEEDDDGNLSKVIGATTKKEPDPDPLISKPNLAVITKIFEQIPPDVQDKILNELKGSLSNLRQSQFAKWKAAMEKYLPGKKNESNN